MLSHSVSECQSDESAEIAIFAQNWFHDNVPSEIGKWGPDRSSALKTLSFGEKIAKIGPADPEVICLREIIKNDAEVVEEEDKKERN